MKNQTLTFFRRFRIPQFFTLLSFLGIFGIVLICPLISLFSKAFLNKEGNFARLENYIKYFNNPNLSASIWNTIDISLVSTIFSIALGFTFAYALTRTNIIGKTIFKYIAMIPIFIPTIVHAIGLVYLFGNQGFITRLGLNIGLYGRTGIIISEIIFTFPQAFLMFFVALEYSDGRLYDAAHAMGIPKLQRFLHITLPDIKYTVINAFFVCFTLAFADFGAPKVLGGDYNVLATDIYKQIAGQFNMNMGAVVGTLLLLPAVLSFITDRIVNSKNTSTLNSKATKLIIEKSTKRDTFFFMFCILISLCFLLLIASLFMGALTEYYPYKMSLTLKNFIFNDSTGGIGSFYHSLEMSLFTALFGTVFVFIYAYLCEKIHKFNILRKIGKLFSVLPLALPGMVIGISFIFFFNNRNNPLNFISGTVIILVVSNILHYFSVPFITATGALKKLDTEFESVSESMNIPRYKTLFWVTVPLSLPAILEIFIYYFVNSMVTVSAVVFLYSANFRIASIAISHMEESGNISQAAAMGILILFINILVRSLYEIAIKLIKKHSKKKERNYE